jgi:hypothetical protein
MEAVAVAPMNIHRQIREAASCDALLMHRPDVPKVYDADLANLAEWLDLASFNCGVRARVSVRTRKA